MSGAAAGLGVAQGTASRAVTAAQRVVFIDQARALAITMMILGHSLDRFLGEPWRSSDVYLEYQFIRGITSALFLMVSGCSFVVASFKHWEEYTRWSPRLRARLRRIALIYLLGYALNIWVPTLWNAVTTWNPDRWAFFLQFDILQNIATGLLLLHLTVLVAGRPERFWKVTLAGYFAVIALGTLTFRPEVHARLPVEVASIVNMYDYSTFPLVPWMGFLLLGATLGYWYWDRRRRGDEWKVFAACACAAIGLLVFEHAVNNWIPGGLFPYTAGLVRMPGNMFSRGGFALLIICSFWLIGRWKIVLPRLSFVLSKDSLVIYFVHLILIYGWSWFPGCFVELERGMTPLQAFTWIASLFAAMATLAWAIGWMRKHRGDILRMIRHTLLAGFIGAFFLWGYLDTYKFIASMVVAAWAVVSIEWLRHRRRDERLALTSPVS